MMGPQKHWAWPTLLVVCVCFVFGCSPSGVETIDTESVEGIVTLDGKPVEGATVTFVPVTQGQGVSAVGKTDAEGKVKLTAVGAGAGKTGEAGAGTVEGEYYVGVIKTEAEEQLTEEEAEEQGVELPEQAGPPSEGKITYVVPKKYGDPKTSGIRVTVKKGENTVEIPLTSQ